MHWSYAFLALTHRYVSMPYCISNAVSCQHRQSEILALVYCSYILGNQQTKYQSILLLTFCEEWTHWNRVAHIYISKIIIIIIGSDNGLAPGQCQAITWTNAGILLIGSLEINFSEILIESNTFSFKKMHLKMSSAKWGASCLDLNVLIMKNGFSWEVIVKVRFSDINTMI